MVGSVFLAKLQAYWVDTDCRAHTLPPPRLYLYLILSLRPICTLHLFLISLSLSSATAGVLELEPAAAPATVLESEGTGGSTLVTPDMGNEGRLRPRGSHGRGL